MQHVIAITIVVLACAYLAYRLYNRFRKKDDCDNGNCGC